MVDILQKPFALPCREGVREGVGVLHDISSILTESKDGRRVDGGVLSTEYSPQGDALEKDEFMELLNGGHEVV